MRTPPINATTMNGMIIVLYRRRNRTTDRWWNGELEERLGPQRYLARMTVARALLVEKPVAHSVHSRRHFATDRARSLQRDPSAEACPKLTPMPSDLTLLLLYEPFTLINIDPNSIYLLGFPWIKMFSQK